MDSDDLDITEPRRRSAKRDDMSDIVTSDDDANSDTFDKENEDTEETEEESTEAGSETVTDEEVTEDEDDEMDDFGMELDDDDDSMKSRRTVSVAGRKRGARHMEQDYGEETNASTIMVSLGDDVDTSPHIESIIYRQTLPIYRWLSILRPMNTRYLTNGSRLEMDRWSSVSDSQQQESVELYLVKWRNLSYLHCSWESEASLIQLEGTRVKQKIIRFLRNEANLLFDLTAYGTDVYFNPDFVEVDRILDVRIVPKVRMDDIQVQGNPDIDALLESTEYGEHGDFVKEFRVKWNSLQYKDLSWEVFQDFQDKDKIDAYFDHLNRDISDQIHEPSYRPPISAYKKQEETVLKDDNVLRSYQVEGINWLLWNWINRRNSILADEMGLGKTVQSALFMHTVMKDYRLRYPFLVVAPLSTIPHWEAEIRRWTDMYVVVLHGSVESRENILKYEWRSKMGEFDILITTYEVCITEGELLRSIPWSGVVVDEAHRLKGRTNKLGEVLRTIQFGCKILLTGTPLQNNTEELWTLLNFLHPERFDDAEKFQEEFGDIKDATQLEKLHNLLKPLMLRRMKEDVEKSLKPKEETVINVEMTATQKKYYRAVYDHNTSIFLGTDGRGLPSLMNIMMELRKCCNHPFLIRGVETSVIEEIYENEKIPRPAKPIITVQDFSPELALKYILNTSGKMVLLDKLLPKLYSQGHRVLLFSQMVTMLNIIQDYLTLKGYTYERIDGSVKISDRQAAIDRFCAAGSDRFIFLICTRAGGVGINLTAADTVIIYDSDWNPQNDIQAQARCHRIGQDKPVKVYRLITSHTYEMEMFQRASLKLGLDKAVLNPLKQNIKEDGRTEMNKMSKKDAETLLKYGAYDLFKEEREGRSEERSNAFCEADIEQILEKNAKVITIDSQGGSSFSKASFITDTSDEVDINDPDFWTKIVGLKRESMDVMGPRSRNKRYSPHVTDDEPEPAGFVDEVEWTKVDRDTLLKMLLTYGWGQWDSICANERLQKHNRSAVQIMAISMVGQITRAQYMISENQGSLKNGAGNGGVRVSQQAKEAMEKLRDTYAVCGAILDSAKRAEAGEADALAFPHAFPRLVRDSIWWQHEVKVCHRHLVQISFMLELHSLCNAFHVQLGGIPHLPVPRRAAQPTPWWTMQEDYDMLVGVKKYGWGNWKEICLDPDLCFVKQGVAWSGGASSEANAEGSGAGKSANKSPTKAAKGALGEPIAQPLGEPLGEAGSDDGAETTPPSTPRESNGKTFPAPHLVVKRLRRLVGAMGIMHSNDGGDEFSVDYSTTLSPKKDGRNRSVMIGEWTQNELRNLRSTILRWGLPVPPTKPLLRLGNVGSRKCRDESTFFTVDNVPLTPEQDELEDRLAAVASVLGGILQSVCAKVGDVSRAMEVQSQSTSEAGSTKVNFVDDLQNHAWLDCYPVDCHDPQRFLGLYSNRLGPFEFLRLQAKLKTKTALQVRRMARQMEKRSIERFQASREVHGEGEEGKKDKEDITDVIPSNIIGQRIYRRLQLYYDIQQYIWDKDEATMRAILRRWEIDGPRRQDHLSDGWQVQVHDIALIRGLRKWGFVEWDMLWSDAEMPFIKPVHEKKKEGEGESDMAKAYNDEVLISAKTMDRSLLVPGLVASQAIRRVQSLLEMFKDYNAFAVHDEFDGIKSEDAETQKLKKGHVLITAGDRRISVFFDKQRFLLPAEVHVTETMYWRADNMTVRPSVSRSEVNRGDVSRAQLSSNALHFYQNWMEMESEVREAGMSPKHITPEMRQKIHVRASEILLSVELPIRVRSVTFLSFGSIQTRWTTYHSDKYIWPIGFKSVKSYFSFVNPAQHVEYVSEILDGGSRGPVFSVTATDDKEHPILASTPTACWTTVLQRVRKERAKMGLGRTGTAVSGPEFFGYAMPEIAACIEGLEGAELCKQYIPRCLRMENTRKSRPRVRRAPASAMELQETEALDSNERPSKRRAAQIASQKWLKIDEDEEDGESASSSDESEESLSDMESESSGEDDDDVSRKSYKRVEKADESQSKNSDNESSKRIRTEELC